jgi:hypothetical protein
MLVWQNGYMKAFSFLLAAIALTLMIGGGTYAQKVRAQDTETPTPTETETPTITPTETPTPEGTGAATEAPTETPTRSLYVYATVSSGQPVAVVMTVTAGELFISGLLVFVIGLLIFGLFVGMAKKPQ